MTTDPFATDYTPTGRWPREDYDYLVLAAALNMPNHVLPHWTQPDVMDALRGSGYAVPEDNDGPARLTPAGVEYGRAWQARRGSTSFGFRPGGPFSPISAGEAADWRAEAEEADRPTPTELAEDAERRRRRL